MLPEAAILAEEAARARAAPPPAEAFHKPAPKPATVPMAMAHYMLPQAAVDAEEAARAGGAPPPAHTGFHKHVAPVTLPDHLGRFAKSVDELAAEKK